LHEAAKKQDKTTLELIIKEANADINARDFGGRSPLFLAAQGKWRDGVHTMLNRGALPNLPDKPVGNKVIS